METGSCCFANSGRKRLDFRRRRDCQARGCRGRRLSRRKVHRVFTDSRESLRRGGRAFQLETMQHPRDLRTVFCDDILINPGDLNFGAWRKARHGFTALKDFHPNVVVSDPHLQFSSVSQGNPRN